MTFNVHSQIIFYKPINTLANIFGCIYVVGMYLCIEVFLCGDLFVTVICLEAVKREEKVYQSNCTH